MVIVSVDLGSIKVTGKKHGLSLELSSSFTIMLPAFWPASCVQDELCNASMAGKLWVAKAGSCQIEFVTLFNGLQPEHAGLDPSIMAAILGLASDCPIWKDLDLELRSHHTCHDRLDPSPSQVSYFLHHPDLSSEMIVPPDVPLARFQRLVCEVDYRSSVSRGKAQTPRQPSVKSPNLNHHASDEPRKYTYSLRSNPRPSRKAAAAHEEILNVAPISSSALNPTPNSKTTKLDEEENQKIVSKTMIREMTSLLDSALRKLIGVKRAAPEGISVKSTQSRSLIDIAPAVWNLRYLQTMTAHAHVIPTIAAGLARLRNAQSASLRQKLDNITGTAIQGSNNKSESVTEASTADEIRKRLWLLCQSGIRPEPVKRHNAKKGPEEDAIQRPPSQADVGGSQLVGFATPLEHAVCFDGHDFIDGGYQPATGYDGDLDYQQELHEPELPDAYDFLDTDGPCGVGDSEESPEECTDSSEADYFYADGYGNVYRIEKPTVPSSVEFCWPSSPLLVETENVNNEGRQEIAGGGGEDVNETYIMYDEMQQWGSDVP